MFCKKRTISVLYDSYSSAIISLGQNLRCWICGKENNNESRLAQLNHDKYYSFGDDLISILKSHAMPATSLI